LRTNTGRRRYRFVPAGVESPSIQNMQTSVSSANTMVSLVLRKKAAVPARSKPSRPQYTYRKVGCQGPV
jgi:hypothetical protein